MYVEGKNIKWREAAGLYNRTEDSIGEVYYWPFNHSRTSTNVTQLTEGSSRSFRGRRRAVASLGEWLELGAKGEGVLLSSASHLNAFVDINWAKYPNWIINLTKRH